MVAKPIRKDVKLGQVYLKLNNPRFEPVTTEDEAIEILCKEEKVFGMAKDIVAVGLSPIDLTVLIPIKSKAYQVEEGNRRVCALKLLNDPERAPNNLKDRFRKLAKDWPKITIIEAHIFKTSEQAKPWVDRLHLGAQEGAGRRSWDSDQKERASEGTKNKRALALLDYAEKKGFIDAKGRKRKLTTVTRFISNPVFRDALGFDLADNGMPETTRDEKDLETLLKIFIDDLITGEIGSRDNKKEIEAYADKLRKTEGLNDTRSKAKPVKGAGKRKRKKPKPKPKAPSKLKTIDYNEDIFQALEGLGVRKLSSFYHSLTTIELEDHTPLIAVGAWSFLETLSACIGRNDKTSFGSFWSKQWMKTNNLPLGDKSKPIAAALTRIQNAGNHTKHHEAAATYDSKQLNNDMTVLLDVILKSIDIAKNKK